MKLLIANLGSTSSKYRLFDIDTHTQLARGAVQRIGSAESECLLEIGGETRTWSAPVPDHGEALRQCLTQLTDPDSGCLADLAEISAIGLKAVHGGQLSGVRRITPEVLAAMEEMNPVMPAHNPPYLAAMRQLAGALPEIPLVAAFETDFHRTIPARNRHYAVPHEWATRDGILRLGFHGASHRWIATRTAELLGRDDLRVISCHLGGSSSLCAIRNRESVATSMGYSAQSGLPQNNRVGDLDPFVLPTVLRRTGRTLDEVLDDLSSRSGLLGISGVSGDLRDIERAARDGNERAKLAHNVYTSSVRHYLGAYLVELGGADVIAFTGGIGENQPSVRATVSRGLEELGIELDAAANESATGEARISAATSRVAVWVVPANEEWVVASLVARKLKEDTEGTESTVVSHGDHEDSERH